MSSSVLAGRRLLLAGVLAAVSCSPLSPSASAAEPPPMETVAEASDLAVAKALLLAPGQIQTVAVNEVERVAVGDPDIADVTIVSPTQLLIQAKKAGTTNLIVWDAGGERPMTVSVVDPQPEAISRELTQVLTQLRFPGVEVKLKGDKVFLLGSVATDDELGSLNDMAATLKGTVFNLVTVKPSTPPPPTPPPMVKMSVQIVELRRTDLEKLGVDWSDSIGFTEQSIAVGPAGEIKTNEAIVGTDDSIAKRVGEAFRIGRLIRVPATTLTINMLVEQSKARVLAEPKLVTASGKEASSFIGVEVPIIKATSFGSDTGSVSASIEFRNTGVVLKMTPTVLTVEGETKITTVIESEISEVDSTVGLSIPVGTKTITVPGFKVRKATTEVTTASSETIMIAGLLEATDTDDLSQVPGLGTLPVIGRLFRSPATKSVGRELVIVITPELLRDEGQQADRQLALEQALAVAEVTASVDDPRLRYALQIQERIAKTMRYPQREKELNIDGTVKLKLHLFADGTLGRALIAESSGIEALDLEALKAAESQSPFPGFPSQLTERELWLEIPVIFRP